MNEQLSEKITSVDHNHNIRLEKLETIIKDIVNHIDKYLKIKDHVSGFDYNYASRNLREIKNKINIKDEKINKRYNK